MTTDREYHGGKGNPSDRNPSVGYDKSDLSARGILIFFFVLAIFAVAVHLGVLGLYIGMTRFAEKHEPETSPLAPQTYQPRNGILTNTANVNTQQFPEPRLETYINGSGSSQMAKFLLQESAELTAQPWRDAQGNVHLPIDQAMQAVMTRLPARPSLQALPNYPGAAREYSYPAAPSKASGQSDLIESKPENAEGNTPAVP